MGLTTNLQRRAIISPCTVFIETNHRSRQLLLAIRNLHSNVCVSCLLQYCTRRRTFTFIFITSVSARVCFMLLFLHYLFPFKWGHLQRQFVRYFSYLSRHSCWAPGNDGDHEKPHNIPRSSLQQAQTRGIGREVIQS